jgi:hypothetical protein
MTRHNVPAEDVALYWEQRAVGKTAREAAKAAGIHYNTALKWEKKARDVRARVALDNKELAVIPRGGAQRKQAADHLTDDLNGPIPKDALIPRARKGLEDFDFFRRIYLGRAPSPWQVEAAYTLVELLESDDKQYVCLNVPPGAGKSTLFHDVACWMICRDRTIRILIGSVSGVLAKQYSNRIRQTLERTEPLIPTDYEMAKGLAVPATACLAVDYGRFRPAHQGSLWRSEEFIVDQIGSVAINNKEPTVSAYGMDAEFIGHRANLCLFDDVANTENSKESAARDRLLEKWDNVAEARCEAGGLLALIGQRLSPSDLYAHCLNKKAWDPDDPDVESEESQYHHIVYKAYYEELDDGIESRKQDAPAWPEGPLLDPKRIPWKDLIQIKSNNRRKFEIVYQQNAADETNNLILRVHATGGMGPDGVMYPGCIDSDRQPGYAPPDLRWPVLSIGTIDPSPTEYWAVNWWLFQPETGLRYLVDLERSRMTAEEILGFDTMSGVHGGVMEDWQHRSVVQGYPITHWVVETNAAQRFLLAHDFVRRWQAKWQVQIIPHQTHRNKWDERYGIEALLPPLWRSGAVRIPSLSNNWKTLALLDEMTKWTPDKKRGTDLVMAHWFAELHWPNVGQIQPPPRMWRPSFMVAG